MPIFARALSWLGKSGVAWLLVSLGFGIVTFGAYVVAVTYLTGMLQDNYESLGNVVLGLAKEAGVTDGLGVIVWAIGIRAAWEFRPRFGRLPSAGA